MPRLALCFFLGVLAPSLFAAGHDLTASPLTTNQLSPVMTGNGSGFTAAWMEPALGRITIAWQEANANGEPIEGSGAAMDQNSVQSMAIAHSPSESLVVWVSGMNVFAGRLSPSGGPLNTMALTSGKDFPRDVAVAWNGSNYFVVWSNGTQLLGTLIATDGLPAPPRPFFGKPVVIGQRAPDLALLPDVAWDGRNFIVVFGVAPDNPCTLSACLAPPGPDFFSVMRVSADGDAIDSTPTTISGTHLSAHLASSGTESLIALDSFDQVTTILAHTEDGLELDAETPLFQWHSYVSSAVAWDGATYTVGWRYVGVNAGPSWLGTAHVNRLGLPIDYRVTATVGALSSGRPSIAVNEAAITAIAVSETTGQSSLARARLYLASELTPMPAPPPAPKNVISYFGGNTARIDWQQSETPAGFALELSLDFGTSWYWYKFVPGDARTTSVAAHVGNLFRVRAFGAGGMSEGTITSIGSQIRRRAGR